METVSCAFFLLCLILYNYGWSDVENEQAERSGVDVENKQAKWMWRISQEDICLLLAKKHFYVLFFIDIQ